MRRKYQERASKVLLGNVVKIEVIERETYDVLKLVYDDGTSVDIGSSGTQKSNLEITERN